MSRLSAFLRRLKPVASSPEELVTEMVWQHFFAGQRMPGVMLEVGAADPDFLSIGSAFRARAWRVISIEPNPAFAQRHRERGHEILQFACSDHDADDVEFTIVDSRHKGGAASFEAFSSLGLRGRYARDFAATRRLETSTISVSVRRLDNLLASYAPEIGSIDLLAIDVEGWEIEVLRGFNLEAFAPSVAIVENHGDDPAYVTFMADRGYQLWRRMPPNEIYRRVSISDLGSGPKREHG